MPAAEDEVVEDETPLEEESTLVLEVAGDLLEVGFADVLGVFFVEVVLVAFFVDEVFLVVVLCALARRRS